jgi:hypothetical protein
MKFEGEGDREAGAIAIDTCWWKRKEKKRKKKVCSGDQ